MSSTLSRPQTREPESASSAVRIEELPFVDAPATPADDFAGFAHAIVMGIVIGVPIVAAIVAAMVKLAAPDISTAGLIAIVAWVAIWTGVFLGGTVTVGLWSAKQHGRH